MTTDTKRADFYRSHVWWWWCRCWWYTWPAKYISITSHFKYWQYDIKTLTVKDIHLKITEKQTKNTFCHRRFKNIVFDYCIQELLADPGEAKSPNKVYKQLCNLLIS